MGTLSFLCFSVNLKLPVKKPNQTKPNQAKPSQTKPKKRQMKPNASLSKLHVSFGNGVAGVGKRFCVVSRWVRAGKTLLTIMSQLMRLSSAAKGRQTGNGEAACAALGTQRSERIARIHQITSKHLPLVLSSCRVIC